MRSQSFPLEDRGTRFPIDRRMNGLITGANKKTEEGGKWEEAVRRVMSCQVVTAEPREREGRGKRGQGSRRKSEGGWKKTGWSGGGKVMDV